MSDDHGSVPCAACQKSCRIFLVRKEGPNCGKKFMKCNSEYGGCGKFDFLNDDNTPLASSSSKRQQGGPGGVCYKCRKTGHYASACPDNQAVQSTGFASVQSQIVALQTVVGELKARLDAVEAAQANGGGGTGTAPTYNPPGEGWGAS